METSTFVNTVNYEQKCYDWYSNEYTNIQLYNYYANSLTPPCPCDMWSVLFDRRFSYFQYAYDNYCFISRIPKSKSAKVSNSYKHNVND